MPRQPNTSPQTCSVLDTLLAAPTRWRHGYDLSKQTGLKAGTLYPILMRLSEQGWLASRWEEPGGLGRPPRHLYRLTPDGRRQARGSLKTATADGRIRSARPRLEPA